MCEIQVSLLILNYHPVWDGLRATLNSLLLQNKISFEVILSNDVSHDNFREDIEEILNKYKFENYHIIESKINEVTGRNYCEALKAASGMYMYATSPGDLLVDEYVLYRFYNYSAENNMRLCFGDAIYYSYMEGVIACTDLVFDPKKIY